MTTHAAKRRARRIAADEALSWARNLKLNNSNAKLTLSMLALYVDGDGYCFVSIPTLAADTELSPQTVRNRLAWLEEIGAIGRLPQWIDEYGRRNGDAKGRRTSDLIRLMIDVDEEVLEAAAERRRADGSREVNPMPGTGSDLQGDSADPALGLRRPYDSAEGLISEPEPEHESPQAPQGAEQERNDGSDDPEAFAAAWTAWPGHELMRRDLAFAEWVKLTAEQRLQCRAAIPLFVKLQGQHKRDTTPNFHIWIRTRGFDEFPRAGDGASAVLTTSFEVTSAEGRAIKALFEAAGAMLFEHNGRVTYPLPVTPQVMAFGNLPDRVAWPWLEDRQQIAAWSQFLSAHIHRPRPELVTTRGAGDDMRRGMYAPWPWPPRKDGTISQNSEDAA